MNEMLNGINVEDAYYIGEMKEKYMLYTLLDDVLPSFKSITLIDGIMRSIFLI